MTTSRILIPKSGRLSFGGDSTSIDERSAGLDDEIKKLWRHEPLTTAVRHKP